ncbi:hypothetical protein E4U58_004582 [Claviceps cyperi]|nr:hypothetical protein E4U58_004582 [Claviceps cyperi]
MTVGLTPNGPETLRLWWKKDALGIYIHQVKLAGVMVLNVVYKTTSITKYTALFDNKGIHKCREFVAEMAKVLSTSNPCNFSNRKMPRPNSENAGTLPASL